MMKDYIAEQQRDFAAGLVTAMTDGGVSLPYVFLKYYHKMNLSDADAMLIIQLIAFREKEEKAFPTIEEIQSRMSTDGDTVIKMLQRLMKEQIIDIVEGSDPSSGMQVERYTLTPLWFKLAAIISKEEAQSSLGGGSIDEGSDSNTVNRGLTRESGTGMSPVTSLQASTGQNRADLKKNDQEDNLFYIFEQEFGRPLTPMEIDMINGWMDQDRYSDPLILAALKEAVFAGKVSFRYVDRILLDWNRNNIHTVEQARDHTQKFRGVR